MNLYRRTTSVGIGFFGANISRHCYPCTSAFQRIGRLFIVNLFGLFTYIRRIDSRNCKFQIKMMELLFFRRNVLRSQGKNLSRSKDHNSILIQKSPALTSQGNHLLSLYKKIFRNFGKNRSFYL